nr:class I SAM-dependent methyltransferase [Pseudomonadota bacterium]
MLKNRINRTFIEILKSIKYGSLNLTDYDGRVHTFKGNNDGPNAELTLHSNKVISNMVFRGDIAFADDYRNGLWDSQDLSALIEFGLLNHNELNQFIFGSKIQQIISNFSYFFKKNTKSGSKKNIHAHYDLGND